MLSSACKSFFYNCYARLVAQAGDVFGLFKLVTMLRKLKQELFINLTVGTWPSPYFLMFADSIWRGELDTGGWGRGRKKQRWITYRDEVFLTWAGI